MYRMARLSHFQIIIIFLIPTTIFATVIGTDECTESADNHLASDAGKILISRNHTSCGFIGKDNTKFFALQTDNLKLKSGDSIEVSADGTSPIILYPPIDVGYWVTFLEEPRFKFNFAIKDESIMEVEFIQGTANLPLDGDSFNNLKIFSIGPIKNSILNLVVKKSLSELVHLKINEDHKLLDSNTTIPLEIKESSTNSSRLFNLKSSPAYKKCSSSFKDNAESSHELSGPDSKQVSNYLCANIFTLSSKGHYEVDFANFLGISDRDDELIIEDGINHLRIVEANANEFPKRLLSFQGNNLAVLYNRPNVVDTTSQITFKLTVRSKAFGGLINKAGKLDIPPNSNDPIKYELRPKSDEYASFSVKGDSLNGAKLRITNQQGNSINLPTDSFLPPRMTSNKKGEPLILDLQLSPKSSIEIEYKPISESCDGILFEPMGSIVEKEQSVESRDCYWVFGHNATQLRFNHVNLTGGSLELYKFERKGSVFKQIDFEHVDDKLPFFDIGFGWMFVHMVQKDSILDASTSRVYENLSLISTVDQTTITTIGYPSHYPWSDKTEDINIDGSNKSIVLSLIDIDLRSDDQLIFNGTAINNTNRMSIGDINIINKKATIKFNRSDRYMSRLEAHRGFKLVTTEFQKIITTDMNNGSFVTPKNLSSLLLEVIAPNSYYIEYNLTSRPAPTDVMDIIDSRSIFGRKVNAEERYFGATTSDHLLMALRVGKQNKFLPSLSIDFKAIRCNVTTDHVCDNSTRCVPAIKLCKGSSYCEDGSDLYVRCSSGPSPNPKVIESGVSGMAVFIISMLMFVFGALCTLYGPDLYKSVDTRLRSGQYTTFTSTE